MSNLKRNTITSMEVAEMVGKEHSKLLRDIRNYVVQLGEAKIGFTDFFKEATYTTEQNKILPCFQVTKKGCEFIAHKIYTLSLHDALPIFAFTKWKMESFLVL